MYIRGHSPPKKGSFLYLFVRMFDMCLSKKIFIVLCYTYSTSSVAYNQDFHPSSGRGCSVSGIQSGPHLPLKILVDPRNDPAAMQPTEDPIDARTKIRIRVLGCGDSKNMSKVCVLKKMCTYVQRRTYKSFWGVCGDMLVSTKAGHRD
jgi:hypothetical protein